MPEELALFDILLSPERSEHDRLESLYKLRPFLETQEAAAKLAEAATTEASLTVKTAMIELLSSVDITRLSDRAPYIAAFALFACTEPERPLRYMAVSKLSSIAANAPEVQEILAETLVNDLDEDVQLLSITGLQNCLQKTEETIRKIGEFIPFAPANCRFALFELVKQLPQEQAQALAVAFLDPLESAHLRIETIRFLSAFPALSAEVLSKMITQLETETNIFVRNAVIDLLAANRHVDTTVFQLMFASLQRMPDQPELLKLVIGRLVAHPELQDSFITLFEGSSSAGLKIRLLRLLNEADIPAIIISGLKDKNPYVREATIPLLTAKFPRFQEQIEAALAVLIKEEPLSALRQSMIRVLLETGRKSPATEALMVELAVSETDHRLKFTLAEAVLQVAITDQNRTKLLELFREIIEGAYFPDSIKTQVTERLQKFAHTNEPDLKKSLGLLLEQSTDIREINTIYQLLRTLEPDLSQLAPLLIRSLYRHIAYYPQQPLDEWVQLLGKLADQHADIRAELPHIISLTKANWLLKGTDKADQTGAFLPAFKQTIQKKNGMQTFMEAERLLNEAWNNRTIKKAEVIELYKMLLSLPKADGILHQLLNIMQQGKLVTPELVQLSLDYILLSSDSDGVYVVSKYLKTTGFIDLEYRDRVLGIFTQENYRSYMQYNLPTIHSKTRYKNMNEWEYSGWISPYGQWPVAELVFAIEPGETVLRLFSELPPAEDAPEATIQYLVLEHLFRKSSDVWAKYVYSPANIGRFLETLYKAYVQLPDGNALKDRILFVLSKKWDDYYRSLNNTPIPAEMAVAGAEVYSGILKKTKELTPDFNGKQFPNILKGMNKDIVKQHWPWSEEIWAMFEYKYFPKADPDQEAAEKLYQQAAKYLQAGDNTSGYNTLKDLMTHYSHTKLVKEQQYNIDNALHKLSQQ